MAIPSESLKKCTVCGLDKPRTEYYFRKEGYIVPSCKECCKKRVKTRYIAERPKILAQGRDYQMAKRQMIKEATFAAYGGYVCACCGEKEPKFLTLDHVNNDGAAHRRSITGKRHSAGTHTYEWLLKRGFPPGYQILCMNCNHGKRMNNGVCPHKIPCNDYPLVGVESSDSKHKAPAVVG